MVGKNKRSGDNFFTKLKRSFLAVKSHKILFITQILATILFVSALGFILFKYTIEAVEHEQYVISAIESIPLNDPLSSPLGSDPLEFYTHVKGVRNALLLLVGFSFLAVLFLNGVSWLITKMMISKKNALEFLKSYLAVTFAYAVPFLILFYYTLKFSVQKALGAEIIPNLNLILWVLLLLLMYFYYISLSLSTNSRLLEIPKKTIKNALNFRITLPVFAFSLMLIAVSSLLVFYLVEASFPLLILAILILLVSVSYSRVLFSVSFE